MKRGHSSREVVAVGAVCLFLVGFGGSIVLVALPAIGAEFHTEVRGLARLGATLALGSALALPLAVIADRRRRGAMAAMGIAGFSLAALISASSAGLDTLAVARFFAVCLEALVAAVATAAAVEAVAEGHRGRTTALLALSSGAGAAVTVVAYPLVAPHWRWLYLAAAIIGLLLSPVALRLPDHPVAGQHGLGAILHPPWRRRLALLTGSAALAGLLYEPANFFAVLFGSTHLGLSPTSLSLTLAASGLAAAAGFAVGGTLTDQIGRRLPAIGLLLISVVLAAASYADTPAMYVASGIAWSAAAGAATPIASAWTAELVPSRARITAYTLVGMAGAVGGVAGLQLVGVLSATTGVPVAIRFTAIPALLGAGLLLALPETRGAPLPD